MRIYDLSTYTSSGATVEASILNDQRNKLSTSNMSTLDSFGDDVIIGTNVILQQYGKILKKYTISENMPQIYRYKPGMYAMDKYGTTAMSQVILYINNMMEPADFNSATVKYLSETGVHVLLSLLENNKTMLTGFTNRVNVHEKTMIKEIQGE